RFRLTCVTRIFQKSVFTKFAHGRRPAAGAANVGRASPAVAIATGTGLRCGSPVSGISTVISLLFFFSPVGDASRSPRLRARHQIAGGGERIGDTTKVGLVAALTCAAEKRSFRAGGRPSLFSPCYLQCGLWAHCACNCNPRLSCPAAGRTSARIFEF